ncbi:hypothetical protein CSB37_00480 [bacterium DOLZORAL124_38_8]|nr:MAG: hypothetical protein CSB37_00480 [bacterium DOLZORAL124_38_8]
MKKIYLGLALLFGCFLTIESLSARSFVGFRYPRTFNGYMLKKRQKIPYHRRNTNRPRFRLSRKNIKTPFQNTQTDYTKKFSTPNYYRPTRKQIQRAGIFCELVEQRIPNTECLKTVDTRPTHKIKYHPSSKNRYTFSKRHAPNKNIKKRRRIRRTFSRRSGFHR